MHLSERVSSAVAGMETIERNTRDNDRVKLQVRAAASV
jgi:hypothetical protein